MMAADNYNVFSNAYNADLSLVKWLWAQANIEQRKMMIAAGDYRVFQSASVRGELDAVKWLWAQTNEEQHGMMMAANNYGAFRKCCARGHLTVVKWLSSKANSAQHEVMREKGLLCAAVNKQFVVFFWLKEGDSNEIAEQTHLNCVQ